MTATGQSKDRFNDYDGFVDKFKPKKTTDDCYTPPDVYECVADWACQEYGIDRNHIMRPFYPGGDFEHFDYPDGCVVLDNPPFSIVTRICTWYADRGIPFFLFAPNLTNFSTRDERVRHVISDTEIEYNNGAKVRTSFLTSFGDYLIRTAPDLTARLNDLHDRKRQSKRPTLPKYDYPTELLTVSVLNKLAKSGIDYRVLASDCVRVSRLDEQEPIGKAIFGSGYLLSVRAAAERAAAERAAAGGGMARYRFELSDREREIIAALGR